MAAVAGDALTGGAGPALLRGVEVVARLLVNQWERDRAAGLATAGFVSGYRGSPLGELDTALERAELSLRPRGIVVRPGVNEDVAATAVWGSQQTDALGEATVDGVFALWYGKGPGVARSGDVLKHANLAGTSRHGGVIALAGDDHTCRSSTTPHHSELTFVDAAIPLLLPATLQELLDFGVMGWAMSRYSGCWVGLKIVADIADATGVVDVDPHRVTLAVPDFALPAGGVHLRIPSLPVGVQGRTQEANLFRAKLPAAQAFARANRFDRVLWHGTPPRLGLIAAGKAYQDLRQALDLLGLGEERAAALGIGAYKVGLAWPLDAAGAEAFAAAGYADILIIEEKRGLIESQFKEVLFGWKNAPAIHGKRHAGSGELMLPIEGELSPLLVARALLSCLGMAAPAALRQRLDMLEAAAVVTVSGESIARRSAHFCSGCPHSTSTNVPAGSLALGGVGCHVLALEMGRNTLGVTHMGGEGANWIGLAPFTRTQHVFQNVGDGTYFHSGSLSIRAAIAARHNITYKILYNDAVAMTGGQAVEGGLTAPMIARQMRAEGVERIEIVAEEPERWAGVPLPAGIAVRPRAELMAVQRELRDAPGVSVLIFDQTCAAEKRRRRRDGAMPQAPERVFINELVCEGCGDCSTASNCLSVEPVETEFGYKRQIDQSSCNMDLSCLRGFCPSFVTIEGGRQRKPSIGRLATDDIPVPAVLPLARPYDILIAGIGGTGVVTVARILAIAARLEEKGCTVLDMTGMAQKGGAVLSHVRLAGRLADLHAVRIAEGSADLVLGCDNVVAASAEALLRMAKRRTRAVVNDHDTITASFIANPDNLIHCAALRELISGRIGDGAADYVDATRLAAALLGDRMATNLLLLGYAWQRGLIPLSLDAIEKAIEANGMAVAANRAALRLGRLAGHDMTAVAVLMRSATLAPEDDHRRLAASLDETIERRVSYLTAYQNAGYAARYAGLVQSVCAREAQIMGKPGELTEAVARTLFQLMAYKDEYEVARLMVGRDFKDAIARAFEGDLKLTYHLAPPLFARRDPETGAPVKSRYGPQMAAALRLLAKLKFLRGTWLDPFGWTRERRRERQLVARFEATITLIVRELSPANFAQAVELAQLASRIRGFGHIKERSIEATLPRWQALEGALARMPPLRVTPARPASAEVR